VVQLRVDRGVSCGGGDERVDGHPKWVRMSIPMIIITDALVDIELRK
jgi:hypothetical protein